MKLKMLKINSETPGTWSFFWPVLFSWVLFLVLMRYVWPRMGIFEGEELAGAAAYAWIHQIPNMLSVPHIRFFGWNIPVMFSIYDGPWAIYSLAPFVAVGGCTLATLRCYDACMFLLALIGMHQLARALYQDDTLAALATFLLAVCPCMVILYSWEVEGASFGVAAVVWTLYSGLLFARTRKTAFAYLGCCSFFLGLCTGPWMAGLGAGMALCFALVPSRWLALFPKERLNRWKIIGGGLLCAGFFLLPVLAYNIADGGQTLKFFATHLIKRHCPLLYIPYFGTRSNLNYWINLKVRFAQVAMLWDGDWLVVIKRKPWYLLYAGPLLFSLIHSVKEAWKKRTLWLKSTMLWALIAGYLLASAISPTEQLVSQICPLAPILILLILAPFASNWKNNARRAVVAAAAVLCLTQFLADFYIFRPGNINLEQVGYYGNSPLVIQVSRWAADRPRTPVIPLSPPVAQALPYFSQNRARVIPFSSCGETLSWETWLAQRDLLPYREFISSEKTDPLEACLTRLDRPLFIAENDANDAEIVAKLKSEAASLGVRFNEIKIFDDQRGRPAFEVFQTQ